MTGIETMLAGLGGFMLGAAIVMVASQRRERRVRRAKVELETRVRRFVVPVLERRADVLAIPPALRGTDDHGSIAVAIALAHAISALEESGELPFGDTVEVSRKELDGQLGSRVRREGA